MRFKDEVKIRAVGGKGGDGAVHWRREKFVPRGGPDGGDGGNGGAVVLVADEGLNTLIDFSFNPWLRAEDGDAGSGSRCTGRNGEDLVVATPVGTQVFYQETLVADLSKPGARWVAARGGIGGKGNHHFRSATNQAPDFAQTGQAGDDVELRLELKSIADIGLVGLPNVGKSTLVGAISRAKPTVADYPFTTLEPNLGVVEASGRKFVIADIPGLIPGAHLGKGLGTTFLRHIERTSAIAQLVDVTTDASGGKTEVILEKEVSDEELLELVKGQFLMIDEELRKFSPELAARKRLVVFTKADLGLANRAKALSESFFQTRSIDTLSISASTCEGLTELKEKLAHFIAAHHTTLP